MTRKSADTSLYVRHDNPECYVEYHVWPVRRKYVASSGSGTDARVSHYLSCTCTHQGHTPSGVTGMRTPQ